jgi:hypothetical protein
MRDDVNPDLKIRLEEKTVDKKTRSKKTSQEKTSLEKAKKYVAPT